MRLVATTTILLLIGSYAIILPLSKRDHQLSAELNNQWRNLRSEELNREDLIDLDIERIRQHLDQVYDSDVNLSLETPFIRNRIQLDPIIQKRMNESFQLIDYINELQFKIEEIEELAGKKKAKLNESVINSFPEHTSERSNPEVLWAELELVYQVLISALNCGVNEILDLEVRRAQWGQTPSLSGNKLIEIPLRLKMSGSMDAVHLFLQNIPLRADEIIQLKLPAAHPEKPALFIRDIMILKNSPSNAHSVEVQVTISGLLYHETHETP